MILVAGLLMMACGTQTEHQAGGVVETSEIAQLVADPLHYEGTVVRFEGVISHICRHSGDKMRVVQAGDETYSMQVMLGEHMNRFDVEDEGREVMVLGTLKTQVTNLDELDADHEHEHDEDGHACESTEQAIRLLAEKGIDPDIRPYVELQAFELR